jgi:hypothetical protein
MGTHGVHLKGVLPWLVGLARRAGTRDFFPNLFGQHTPHRTLFHFIYPHRPEGWADSRAMLPAS